MELNVIWFILLTVLFIGFFFLEGFDYGVGALLPFLGKTDLERRIVINTIGPVWDGNEVWMITAGGAMFAAFPHVYATLFSGFYLALFLMLVALIGRGVAFEFRSKEEYPQWRATWDWLIFFGSVIPAVLWGVTVTNLIQGVPIDAKMHFVGSFFDLLSPYTLVGGVACLFGFIFHGAIYLNLKTEGELRGRSRQADLPCTNNRAAPETRPETCGPGAKVCPGLLASCAEGGWRSWVQDPKAALMAGFPEQISPFRGVGLSFRRRNLVRGRLCT